MSFTTGGDEAESDFHRGDAQVVLADVFTAGAKKDFTGEVISGDHNWLFGSLTLSNNLTRLFATLCIITYFIFKAGVIFFF